jgi:cell wall-associated NlpC family hydrolase
VTARRTRKAGKGAALLAAGVMTVGIGPSALADHHDHHGVIPSQSDVDAARQDVADAQRSVADIQAELAAANQRLEDLGVAAEQAAEAYNGAVVAWQNAQADAKAARQRADQAARQSGQARDLLAGYVLSQSNAPSPQLSAIGSTLTAQGSHGLLREMADADTSARALDAQYQSWSATNELAKVYEKAAEDALAKAGDAKQAAAVARQAAQDAVDAQQSAVASIGVQREALVQELATAQHISVALAAKRQAGLEERRQQRAAERRREAALAAERAQRREERRQQREQQQQGGGGNGGGGGGGSHGGSGGGQGPSVPPPTNPSPPAPSHGAAAAIAFARDQLGEPYVWGAAGPDSWDCSGLTMGAWAAAGVQLSHYSVSQYYETTPISYSQIRPGDLIFWASDSYDPNTIFHVALYIGNGQMIQAPRTGRDVEIQDVWYWESPDFFTRVS